MLRNSLFILFLLIYALPAEEEPASTGPDMYAGPGYFLQPPPDFVITGKIVKLALADTVEGVAVRKVAFYAHYSRYATNKVSRSRMDELIATDSVPPFETIWDCTNVPDQDQSNLQFTAEVFGAHGPITAGRGRLIRRACLDRNPAFNPRVWKARLMRTPVTVDGSLDEWTWDDSVSFVNNDNHITATARWGPGRLYFAARVKDAQVFPDSAHPAAAESLRSFMMDGLELFLDLDRSRTSIRNNRHFQMIVPVRDAKMEGGTWASYEERQQEHGPPKKINPHAAIRRTSDGFCLEVSLDWRELEVKPAAGKMLGVNLVNSDLEDAGGVVVTASWAGISDLLHHDPSEWGTLELAGSGTPVAPVIAGIFLVLSGGVVFYFRRKRQTEQAEAPGLTAQEIVIEKVRQYIRDNVGDEKLDLRAVAAHVDLSPDYLRQLFKKTSGRNFSEYMNHIRIEKAQELLKTTNKRITEIAFESGFGTYQNFNRVFKDTTGCTPKEWRVKQGNPVG